MADCAPAKQDRCGSSKAMVEFASLFKRVMRRAVDIDRDLAARHGLALTDLGCLSYLDACGEPVNAKMVAEHVCLSTGATTALIDRLEKAGLVARRANPNDRRAIVLVLVEENARPILDEHRALKVGLWTAFDGLTEAEAAAVMKFLRTLLAQGPSEGE